MGSKVQISDQNFHSSLKQKQSTKKPLSITSEVFTPPKAALPTSIQMPLKSKHAEAGLGAILADEPEDSA